jgi:hypothetical protein
VKALATELNYEQNFSTKTAVKARLIWGITLKARKRNGKRKKKPSLKRAAQAIAKTIYRYFVELPEEERDRDIAALERAVSRKLKRLRAKK